MELDPIFVRAAKLLLSNSKDSEEQLRSMLEDAIKQRHPNKTLGNKPVKKEERAPRKESSKQSSHKGSEKKTYEKVSLDDNLDMRSPVKSKTSEVSKSVPPPVTVSSSPRSVVTSQSRSRDDDDRGYGLEISLEDDLSCAVCGGMDVGVGNHLVECLDCHTLYHQECHVPTILETDFNDPRSAWYCSACSRETATSSTTGKTPVKSSPKPAVKYDTVQAQNLFKRNESKGVSSSLSGSKAGSSGGGMAGLAASLQSSSNQSSSKSFGSSSTTKSSSPVGRESKSSGMSSSLAKLTNVTSSIGKAAAPNPSVVDKRLSIMKKKAAKQQEQRKHIK